MTTIEVTRDLWTIAKNLSRYKDGKDLQGQVELSLWQAITHEKEGNVADANEHFKTALINEIAMSMNIDKYPGLYSPGLYT